MKKLMSQMQDQLFYEFTCSMFPKLKTDEFSSSPKRLVNVKIPDEIENRLKEAYNKAIENPLIKELYEKINFSLADLECDYLTYLISLGILFCAERCIKEGDALMKELDDKAQTGYLN